VLSGEATVTPKSGAGNVEMIVRTAAHPPFCGPVSRSQVTNQLHALTVTAPPALREQLEDRTTRARVLMRRVAGGEGGRGQLAGGPVRTEVGVSVVGGRLRSRGLPGR
jgi:hypothetical protein